MSRQRNDHRSSRTCYHTELLHAIGKLLPHRGLPLQVEDQRVRWTPRLLATCAILMSWLPGRALLDTFEAAREALVTMYPSRRRPGRSCQGFLAALARKSRRMLVTVVLSLQRATRELSGDQWRWNGWVLLAADGSRVECPMTWANEEELGCAGKAKTTPQLSLTVLYHVGLGVPWQWRRGGGKEAERKHLREMIAQMPRRTLLLADAGFTGYELLSLLLEGGHDFVIRVGRNVRLLEKLGYEARERAGMVYLWPKGFRHLRPLTLRLVRLSRGKKRMCLLTSVLDSERLSDEQVAELYELRWGVEVLYRTLKQTMERRRMLSDTPGRALVELDWSMVGLWMLGLMSQRAMSPRRRRKRAWSPAKSLRVVRTAIRRIRHPRAGGGLSRELSRAVKDRYTRGRPKKARHWPHKKREKPPGLPKVRMASEEEIQAAQQLRSAGPSG